MSRYDTLLNYLYVSNKFYMSSIIFLNGCGSAGKTSIARSIQHISDKPWLRLGVDTFIDMMPDKFIAFGKKANEGYFFFVPGKNDRGPTMSVQTGSLGKGFFKSMPVIAKLLADQGNNVIIDEVILSNSMLKLYVDSLKEHIVYFIGIFCDLEQMQEREILRRNRAIGLANDQIDRVHEGIREYDFLTDTTNESPFTTAKNIIEFIDNAPDPEGFKKMLNRL